MEDGPNHLRVGVKLSLPEISAHQDNRWGIRLVVLRQKDSAHEWHRAEHLKVVAGVKRAANRLSGALKKLQEVKADCSGQSGCGLRTGSGQIAGRDRRAEGKQCEVGKGFIVVAIIDVIRVRKSAVTFVRGGARNRCQAVGILHLTRTQDKGIKSSKDRGVDADAQGEREDGHGSEAWILAQHAHAVT